MSAGMNQFVPRSLPASGPPSGLTEDAVPPTLRDRLTTLRAGIFQAHGLVDQIETAISPTPNKSTGESGSGPLGLDDLIGTSQSALDGLLARLSGIAATL